MKRWGEEIIIEVEDVIRPEKVDEYRKYHDVIWNHLYKIAQQIIILRRLTSFPYHLFVPDDKRVFWNLTNKSFFDSIVIALSALLEDRPPSLREFKNKVFNPNEYRIDPLDREVDEVLKRRKKEFNKDIASYKEKIKEVRNNHIAHLDWKKVVEPEAIVPYQISIDVLQQAVDVSESLFHTLSFGTHYQLRSWDYNQSCDDRNELDIDEILEWVVSHSYWFNDDPFLDFDEEYQKLSSNDKSIFDEWRNRIGK